MDGARTRLLKVLAVLAGMALAAQPTDAQMRRPSPPDSSMVRTASAMEWPGELMSRQMASGRAYRPDAWIAGHPTLPLGSRLLIRSADDRRAVVVTVADRASVLETGSMLVSRAAAEALRIDGAEPRPVRYRLLAADEPAAPGVWIPSDRAEDADRRRTRWSVQVGSFSERSAAERFAERLDGARVERVRERRRVAYRVYFGRYPDRSQAEAWRDRLAGWGITGFVRNLDETAGSRIP